jgi:hypothetical protein
MTQTIDVPAWIRPDGVCPAFRWIGQSFATCDGCGEPYWDHTHELTLAHDAKPFSIRERHQFIPRWRRDRVRAKWDRPQLT